MMRSAGRRAAIVAAACLAACAPPRPALPSGTGTPFADAPAAYDEAVRECRDARTVLAELGLSGKAGDTRLRGRINAGIAAPASIRLEGVAPVFGRPIFILAGRNGSATLLLSRENRVVDGAPPEAIVEALTGVALTPAELLAAVAGCGLGAAPPSNGRAFGDDWVAVDAGGGVTYLRRVNARWHVGGASRDGVTVVYGEFANGLPSTIHVRTGSVADITLRVSQLEINSTIDDAAFDLDVPADAQPLTLDELRRSGPLGEREGSER
jgi:hypothetical protein